MHQVQLICHHCSGQKKREQPLGAGGMSSWHSRCGNTSQVRGEIEVQGDEGNLEDVLSLAKYEINVDPYRGLANFKVRSPWKSFAGNWLHMSLPDPLDKRV